MSDHHSHDVGYNEVGPSNVRVKLSRRQGTFSFKADALVEEKLVKEKRKKKSSKMIEFKALFEFSCCWLEYIT